METIYPAIRLTHKFVGTYRHMDEWKRLPVPVKVTPGRFVPPASEDPDPSEGGAWVRYGRLPARLSRAQRLEYRRALEDKLSAWGCSHDYDCCGCQNTSTRVFPTRSPRTVRIVTYVSYNY